MILHDHWLHHCNFWLCSSCPVSLRETGCWNDCVVDQVPVLLQGRACSVRHLVSCLPEGPERWRIWPSCSPRCQTGAPLPLSSPRSSSLVSNPLSKLTVLFLLWCLRPSNIHTVLWEAIYWPFLVKLTDLGNLESLNIFFVCFLVTVLFFLP